MRGPFRGAAAMSAGGLILLALASGAAAAACEDAPPAGCSTATAPPPAPPDANPMAGAEGGAEIVSSTAEGERELAMASRLLSEGEDANDDATRRAKYTEAQRHAERAVALLPQSADAHFAHFGAVGRLAQLDGLAAAAFKLMTLNAELDEVLRLNPDHANALAARGGMLVKLPRLLGGNADKGIAYLQRAVALDREAVGKRLELAEAYHLVGRSDEARRTAEEALAMAETLQDTGRVETCRRFIEELRTACSGCAMAAIGR